MAIAWCVNPMDEMFLDLTMVVEYRQIHSLSF